MYTGGSQVSQCQDVRKISVGGARYSSGCSHESGFRSAVETLRGTCDEAVERYTMHVTYYEGERIYFRPLELTDEPCLRRWLNDPANWRTLARMFPINELRERAWIEELYTSQADCALGIVATETNRLIGATGLHNMHRVNRSAYFGLLIGDAAQQSQGYGREATGLMIRLGFTEFNLNRIELDVFADHTAAIKTYEHVGFVLEGRMREAYFRGGRYVDALRYAVLRSDWLRGAGAVDGAGTSVPATA